MGKHKCTVDGCDRYGPYKLYCTMHYQRVKAYGSPGDAAPERVRGAPLTEECSVEECTLTVRSRGSDYCEKHYFRTRRNGTTATVRAGIPDRECIAPGCKNLAFHTDGHCRNCRLRYVRNGNYLDHTVGNLAHNWLDDDRATYEAVHQRVKYQRGSASKYECVSCGRQARHWAYDHKDESERIGEKGGYSLPFSVNVKHYQPMCVPCHKRLDLGEIKNRKKKDA